ncbi:MAG: DNA-directed RNA polymerase subunit alpha C-terminal domain-containing protein [Planctomycetota bacterium]|jgi:DNA-directed RNA polymerase subunit alpha
MSQLEAPQAPAADPAAFFAAPPSSPSELVQARRRFLANADSTEKFESAVREARAGGNNTMAALGSWVTGEYRKALEFVDGNDDLAVFIKGMSEFELGNYEGAAATLAASAKSADEALAAAALESLLGTANEDGFVKALSAARLSAADALHYAGRALELERKYEEAVAKYQEVLELDPEHVAARFRLAYRADLFGDDEVAIQLYESFLQSCPIPVSVLINLGILYEDRNDFERACGCFGAVLRRDPNNAVARLFFADSHDSLDMFYDENLELKEDQLMKVLRTPISDFELSVRARNCLSNMDIKSLGDLVSHSEQELLEFKNFGETSLNEIKRVLTQKGLRLGMRREDGSFVIPEEFDAARSVDIEAELAWLGTLTEEMREALELQISTLNLSVRCHRALVERLNLQRVGDILLFSEEDLLGMPNFGITSLNELQKKLTEFGLRLRSGRGEEYSGD